MNYLTVDLYKDFECIADTCPNTCCSGWGIIIDKDTHNKMIEHEETLGLPAKDWLLETDSGILVKLNQNRCPMLDEHNLCTVVNKLGPDFLSHTCQQYPRIFHQYGNTMEGYLTMSCPVVADKLIDKDTIQFDFGEDQTAVPPYPHTQLYLYETAVRSDIISMIQSFPDISINTRLFVSYKIIERAIQIYQGKQEDYTLLSKEIDCYFQSNTLFSLDTQLQNVVNESDRYHFLQKIQVLIHTLSDSGTFSEQAAQTMEYFSQTTLEKYLSDLDAFRSYMQSYKTFYTNFWVYNIFSNILNIPDYALMKKKLIYIATKFCLIQTVALAIFANNKEVNRNEYIYIISCISRKFEHSSRFRQQLDETLVNNNMISLAGLLLLLLN